jgi:polysaccharide biosynthesis transport protein
MSQSSQANTLSNSSSEPQQSLLNFAQAQVIILRRKWLVLGIAGISLGISGMMAAKTKPDYQSSMQLLVSSSIYQESRESQNKSEPNFTDSNLHVDYTAQLQVMTSVRLLSQATEILKKEYPTLTIEELRGNPGKKSRLSIVQLQEGIGSNKVPSQVFVISFTDKDPVKTKRVLETLRQVYLENNIEEQKQRLDKGLTFINDQLPKVKAQVTQSENALELFRRQYQLIDPDSQGKKLLDSIAYTQEERRKIRAEFQQIQAQMASNQQKLAYSPQEALSTSRLSQSSRYQALLNEIQKTDLVLAEKKVLYRDDNEELQMLRQQRQQQMALLQAEMGRVLQNSEAPQSASLNQGQFGSIDIKLAEQLVEHQTQLAGLSARDRILLEQEQQITQTLKQYPKILSEYNRLKPEADFHRKALEDLLQSQRNLGLKIAQGGFEWRIMEDPQLGFTEGSGTSMRLVMGVVVGAILGSIAALIAEQLDPVIYGVEELRKCSDLPFLGNLRVEKSASKSRSQIIDPTLPTCLRSLSSPMARRSLEQIYRNLQSADLTTNDQQNKKSIVITAGQVNEGSLFITLGIALSAAHQNQRILIIDADGSSCPLNQVLHLSNEIGLADLLAENSNYQVSQAVQFWQPQIDILTAGETMPNTMHRLSSPRMMDILADIEPKYDVVLIHANPILDSISTSWMNECRGLVLVSKLGITRRPNLAETLEAIEGTPKLGIMTHNLSLDFLKWPITSMPIALGKWPRLMAKHQPTPH